MLGLIKHEIGPLGACFTAAVERGQIGSVSVFFFFERGILLERIIILPCTDLLSYSQSNFEASFANMSYSCTGKHSGTDSKISLSSFALQLCFCPQLMMLASDMKLRPMVTTCAWKPRCPRTQQGPSISEKQPKRMNLGISTGFPGRDLPVCGMPRVLCR